MTFTFGNLGQLQGHLGHVVKGRHAHTVVPSVRVAEDILSCRWMGKAKTRLRARPWARWSTRPRWKGRRPSAALGSTVGGTAVPWPAWRLQRAAFHQRCWFGGESLGAVRTPPAAGKMPGVFPSLPPKPHADSLELAILDFWERERVFEQLREKNAKGPRFSFIDGPVTANKTLGVHTAWGRTLKDVFQR